MPTLSRRQRRRREAGSEGSPRRNPAPRNAKRVRGVAIGVSRPYTAKPVITDTADPDRVWVACDVGVFESRDAGGSWAVFGTRASALVAWL